VWSPLEVKQARAPTVNEEYHPQWLLNTPSVFTVLRRMGTASSSTAIAPLGATSTAKEVVERFGGPASCAGKVAVVTGTSSGIGTETARQLVYAGAYVLAGVRNVPAGIAAFEAMGIEKDKYQVEQLDLEDLDSISAFAAKVNALQRIDFLVFNAGIMALPTLEHTKYGWEKQLGTNHHGHFHLLTLVLPKMKAQSFPSRIVAVSSMAHRRGELDLNDLHFKKGREYAPFVAYGQSKGANILMIRQLADDLGPNSNITALSLHPGVIYTNLTRHMSIPEFIKPLAFFFFADKTVEQGASTTLAACLDPQFVKHSGAYLSHCQVELTNEHWQDASKELRRGLWAATAADIAAAASK